jgi:GT2 family glycosyltransferase
MTDSETKVGYSIIIPSYNSNDLHLTRCLMAISRELQSQDNPYEIIVVESSLNIPILPEITNTKLIYSKEHLYAGEARNMGAHEAKYSYYVFVDADVELLSGAFRHIIQGLKDGLDVVGGVYEFNNPHTGIISTLQDLLLFYRNKQVKPNQMNLSGRCFSIKAEVFWSVGGFSPNIITYEDAELVLKLKKKNCFRSTMDTNCRGYHLKNYNFKSIFFDYFEKARNMFCYRLLKINDLHTSEFCFNADLSASYYISGIYLLLILLFPFTFQVTSYFDLWVATFSFFFILDFLTLYRFLFFVKKETGDGQLVLGSYLFFKATAIPAGFAFLHATYLVLIGDRSFLNNKKGQTYM